MSRTVGGVTPVGTAIGFEKARDALAGFIQQSKHLHPYDINLEAIASLNASRPISEKFISEGGDEIWFEILKDNKFHPLN